MFRIRPLPQQHGKNELSFYPTTSDLTSGYAFGFLVGIVLVLQLVTGLFMASHYDANVDLAFDSIDHVMRDLPYGATIKNMHLTGASSFFVCLYLHMAKAIYNGSYIVNRAAWNVGLVIFVLTMLTAFCGYCLPFGQMSYWGTIVITNLIGVVGKALVINIWGAFEITSTLLQRFLVIHFITPFVITFLVFLHIALVHRGGSSSVLNKRGSFLLDFTPYYIFKDGQFLTCLLGIMLSIALYTPDLVNHPDNFMAADPLVTPAHIQPEWYFLPYYAILRAVPNKDLGILLMGASILGFAGFGLFGLDTVDRRNRVVTVKQFFRWKPRMIHYMNVFMSNLHQAVSVVFFLLFVLLIYLGSAELDSNTQEVLTLAVIGYFSCMLYFIGSSPLPYYVEQMIEDFVKYILWVLFGTFMGCVVYPIEQELKKETEIRPQYSESYGRMYEPLVEYGFSMEV